MVKGADLIEYAFGCRHPDTQAGSWSKAYVVFKRVQDEHITTAIFNNNMTYVQTTQSYKEAYDTYKSYKSKQGWQDMPNGDIERTANIDLSNVLVSLDELQKTVQNQQFQKEDFIAITIMFVFFGGFLKRMLLL